MTIHDFDMARFLTGSEAEEIYVAAACMVDPAIGEAGDVDTALITIRFKNGAICVIDNSRKAVYGYDQRVEAFGSKGKVEITNDYPSTAVWSTETGIYSEKAALLLPGTVYGFLRGRNKAVCQRADQRYGYSCDPVSTACSRSNWGWRRESPSKREDPSN